MDSRTIGRYALMAGIVLAVILALWPNTVDAALWLLILIGFVAGYLGIDEDSEAHFFIMSVALFTFVTVFTESGFPSIGEFLTQILEGTRTFFGAAVVALVVRNVIGWFR